MAGFKTDTSELKFQEFPDQELLERCVTDVRENLDEYPPIKIFGKICHQRRCVGFFSDESIGYKYSGQLSKSKPMTSSLITMLTLVNSIFGTHYMVF